MPKITIRTAVGSNNVGIPAAKHFFSRLSKTENIDKSLLAVRTIVGE